MIELMADRLLIWLSKERVRRVIINKDIIKKYENWNCWAA